MNWLAPDISIRSQLPRHLPAFAVGIKLTRLLKPSADLIADSPDPHLVRLYVLPTAPDDYRKSTLLQEHTIYSLTVLLLTT
jgi:hypothetical protein